MSDEWVIRKGGYFYRPSAQGYTSSLAEAGRWSKADAEDHITNGVTIHHVSEFPASLSSAPQVTDDAVDAALSTWFSIEGKENSMRADMRRVLEQFAASAPSAVEDAVWKIGERVEKWNGEARYTGVVVSVYTTTKGGVRYVVEVEPQGFQMICTKAMLRDAP
jgi:hypothetical protein